MTKLNKVFVLLGGNIEPRLHYFKDAMHHISLEVGDIVSSSLVYESDALGFESDQRFLNKVVEVDTLLSANEVLVTCLAIEKNLGRIRQPDANQIMSSRTIDIDILYFNDEIINSENLIIPHPRLHERRFTLMPLCDIIPNFIHPVFEVDNADLLTNCKDKSDVINYI